MSYKGKYRIKKPEKYAGDISNVVFRSLWERNAFRWCENNPKVKLWNSEGVVVPYKCSIDNKLHRYFVDLLIEMETKKSFWWKSNQRIRPYHRKRNQEKLKDISMKHLLFQEIKINGMLQISLQNIMDGNSKCGLKKL